MEYFLYIPFSFLALISSIMVISAKNPIHSVFYLVLVFLNTAVLFLFLGLEFFAIIFIIVYVGAIAILFLFVVMMLNIKLVEINENMLRYIPLGSLIGLIFMIEILLMLDHDFVLLHFTKNINEIIVFWDIKYIKWENLASLGQVLYINYIYFFILAGIILLVAMIGAIVLTLHFQSNIKRQDVFLQTSRHFKKSIKWNNN